MKRLFVRESFPSILLYPEKVLTLLADQKHGIELEVDDHHPEASGADTWGMHVADLAPEDLR
jgi:hypothetical protein